MRVYLAGAMQGIPDFNFPAFHAAAAKLRSDGHYVFSPAENDEDRHGTDIGKSKTGDIKEANEKGFSLRQALYEDTRFICQEAEAIALLPGWEYSKGAAAEWHLARALGLQFIYL